jgi:hypothetical protein
MEHKKNFTIEQFAAYQQSAGFVAVWKFMKEHGDKPLSEQRAILTAWGLIIKQKTSGVIPVTAHRAEAFRDLGIEL